MKSGRAHVGFPNTKNKEVRNYDESARVKLDVNHSGL